LIDGVAADAEAVAAEIATSPIDRLKLLVVGGQQHRAEALKPLATEE